MLPLIVKLDIAMRRLVINSTFMNREYRNYFRREFWTYIEAGGYDPVEVSQMDENEITAMWEMFSNDAPDFGG